MNIIKTGKQTYICDDIVKLCQTLEIPLAESRNWEIYELDQVELALETPNGFEPIVLDTGGSKESGTRITTLDVSFLRYES